MSSELKQLWDNALSEIEISVSRPNFLTWFKNTHIAKKEDGVVHVGVPNEFVKEWLCNKYHKFILKSLRELSSDVRGVEYIVAPQEIDREEQQKENQQVSYNNELPLKDLYINKDDNLNPRYTFETFVVCPFNDVAHAAAQAIVKSPGRAYNPLFLYAETGLGKTHLVQAIGNQIKKEQNNFKIFYTTSEKFYLHYITSLEARKISEFKEKYRKFDVVIMDDVQFFSGKKSTQDEFFHLFNTLYDNNKQVIFSSDKHYNYIPNVEERIKSRFGAGMIIDIAEPDFESRVAILKEKSKERNFPISNEAIEFIAQSVSGSIRELEGILNTVIYQSQFKNHDLSQNELKLLVKNSEKPKKSVAMDDVIQIVADFYNIEKESIHQKTRKKEVVKPRQVIMHLLRNDFNISFPAIGKKLGGRDHTTVIHSCEKIKKELKNDLALNQQIEQIRSMF